MRLINRETLVVLLLIIIVKLSTAAAETVTLNYSQCSTYNDSNGSVIEYCAVAWQDLNITDLRMNLTINGTAPILYYNATWNVTFNSSLPNYGIVEKLDYGENYSFGDVNITCVAPGFPAMNLSLNLGNGSTYNSTLYNISIKCQQFDLASCKENIDKTLKWAEDYYNDKCNIHIRAPPRPYADAPKVLLNGESFASITDFFSSYSCENTTPIIMTEQAKVVLLGQLLTETNASLISKTTEFDTANASLTQAIQTINEKDETIGAYQSKEDARKEGRAETDLGLFAIVAAMAAILGALIYNHFKSNIPVLHQVEGSPVEEEVQKAETKQKVNDIKLFREFLEKKEKGES